MNIDDLDKILAEIRNMDKTVKDPTSVRKMSEPKVLHKTDWVSLLQRDHYIYAHETRSNGKIVSVLVHDSTRPGHYYGRYEWCPAHCADRLLYSITGGVEHDNPLQTAIDELWEEAGYKANLDEMLFLGDVYPYKAADTIASLYTYDAKGRSPDPNPPGDGSIHETHAYCEWVNEEQVLKTAKDPLLMTSIWYLKMMQPTLAPATIAPAGPQRF